MKLDGKPLIFLGDIHGEWGYLLSILEDNEIEDCNIICVGDLGIGFSGSDEMEALASKRINQEFKHKNINFYGIRGNHDNPYYFQGGNRVVLDNFELIEDYAVLEYNGKTIQCIGGAISIDRKGRREGISYWKDECLKIFKNKCEKVDILVTHTAPSWCSPLEFGEIVYGWANEDPELIQDLVKERRMMDDIFASCDPSVHLYGHFHFSNTEVINSCKHKLLDINELYELKL